MAKGFDKLNVKSAVKDHNKFNLDCAHLTTMDFGQIVPLYVNELVPGDKFNVQANYFSRMAPLVKPTYGKFQFKTIAGFVPMYQLADDAEAFLAGKNIWEGETPSLRYFTDNAIIVLLSGYSIENSAITETNADWSYVTGNTGYSGKRYFQLTPKGKFVYKILCALGYSIPQNKVMSTNHPDYLVTELNAMPLLAFAKLYNDYMSQSQRYNTSPLTRLLKMIKHNKAESDYDPTTHKFSVQALKLIFDNILLAYENDYFTSAWMQPNAPIGTPTGMDGVFDVPADNTRITAGYVNTAFGAPVFQDNTASISQRSLDFLKSFDDWVRRNNYSGSRAVQQVYSRFGIKTEDYRSNYAHVISTDVQPVQVGDVTSQSTTSGAILGDFAGKGIMNGQNGFSFDASDYGYLLILGYFTVTPMNAFGFDRSVLRTNRFDFYNPEFDGLGPDVIAAREIYTNPVPGASDTSKDSDVYGYTERYNSYRFGRDKITGDFRQLNTLGNNTTQSGTPYTEMSVWHTGRILNNVRADNRMIAQSSAMNTMAQTGSEYDRIFADTNDDYDKFYLTCQFNVSAVRPMLSLNQVPRLGEGNTAVPRNGNVIS